MKFADAIKALAVNADRESFPLLDKNALLTMLPSQHPKALEYTIRRLHDAGILQRVKKGLYINATTHRPVVERPGLMAAMLRPGCLSYLSLESALAEWGSISQGPMRYTMMTTGRRGEFATAWGSIEFTHTGRSTLEILERTELLKDRRMRIANPDLALEDLRRTRRNQHLVDEEEHRDIVAAWRRDRGDADPWREMGQEALARLGTGVGA